VAVDHASRDTRKDSARQMTPCMHKVPVSCTARMIFLQCIRAHNLCCLLLLLPLQAFESNTQKQAAAVVGQAPTFARSMLHVYQGLQTMSQLSMDSSVLSGMQHCSFTPRDLTAWVVGLKR